MQWNLDLSNVPITNLVISNVYDNGSSTTPPTDQDVDDNSPMVAQGKIYTTFSGTRPCDPSTPPSL